MGSIIQKTSSEQEAYLRAARRAAQPVISPRYLRHNWLQIALIRPIMAARLTYGVDGIAGADI